MTRILSYNILVGGTRRIDFIEQMVRTVDPDVVGLVEAVNPHVVKELARRLDMDYRTNAAPDGSWRTSIALLSRLPIVSSTVHRGGGAITRPLLEVSLLEEHGDPLNVFVNHLAASFADGRGGDNIRRREVRAILEVLQASQEPHLLMGDFNALAPGDSLKASRLLHYLLKLEQGWRDETFHEYHGHPTLDSVVPPQLRLFNPLLRLVPRSKVLSTLFDEAGSLYAPRASIGLLYAAGYIDCFRQQNPRAWGFTCPAANPAGRIDYLFAHPALARRLRACKVVEGNDGVHGKDASDHLPVMAEFGSGVEEQVPAFSTGPEEIEEPVGGTH